MHPRAFKGPDLSNPAVDALNMSMLLSRSWFASRSTSPGFLGWLAARVDALNWSMLLSRPWVASGSTSPGFLGWVAARRACVHDSWKKRTRGGARNGSKPVVKASTSIAVYLFVSVFQQELEVVLASN